MSKNKKKSQSRRESPNKAASAAPTDRGGTAHALRETVESIVIAFVLAFLFRTFEAEAFVIPTGSMSPSLQGQHKDVACSECGYRFRTTASSEGEERDAMIARAKLQNLTLARQQELRAEIQGLEVVAGMCPMCRQTMLHRTDALPGGIPEYIKTEGVEEQETYPGDRILVNKYSYDDALPERWDVVVFKFPGNGEMNYIKRLVGLPGETLRIYQGDLFVKSDGDVDFRIARKSSDKVRAMLEPVHDTDYDPALLYNAGWPLRWAPVEEDGWVVEAEAEEQTVNQKYSVDQQESGSVAWLRYRHLLPRDDDWAVAREFADSGKHPDGTEEHWRRTARSELISDFNGYNARILRSQLYGGPWQIEPHQLGMHWVGELAVECDVDVEELRGQLLLDLVKGGRHFTCTIDLESGKATLHCDGLDDFHPEAQTPIDAAGSYELRFSNIDDQLLLWVDDRLVDFGDATYDADEVFGGRERIMPRTGQSDPGDLAPVGVGANGADLVISRLRVLRDIYYIAVDASDPGIRGRWSDLPYFTDYDPPMISAALPDGTKLPALGDERELFRDPEAWPRFLTRRKREFTIDPGQLFVMGDNSPESQDCRLWQRSPENKGVPGGAYLDRRLLTGKAVCVFWPHSWGRIPGLDKLPGFPNFPDMRIVR
jgi:signal peptidase I